MGGIATAACGAVSVAVISVAFPRAIRLKCAPAKELAKQWPPAHQVGDVDSRAGLSDVPDHINGGERRGEVEVFIQDSGNDHKQSEAHDAS